MMYNPVHVNQTNCLVLMMNKALAQTRRDSQLPAAASTRCHLEAIKSMLLKQEKKTRSAIS